MRNSSTQKTAANVTALSLHGRWCRSRNHEWPRAVPLRKKNIDAQFWRNVEIQDRFWRDIFVDFVRPLKGLFRDPISAGAYVLSAYMADPINAPLDFREDPEAFGALVEGVKVCDAAAAYAQLVLGKHGLPLKHCVDLFEKQKVAADGLAKFATEHPALYRKLQKERTLRNLKRTRIRVQFFGEAIYLEERIRPRKKHTDRAKHRPAHK